MAETSRDGLIAAAVAAFALSPAEVKKLALAIYAARVGAYLDAYRHAAELVGVDLPDDWQPDDDALSQQRDAALTHAQQVADTYRRGLSAAAAVLIAGWLTDHTNSLAGLTGRILGAGVKAWSDARATWKAKQVAKMETAQASQTARTQFASDLTDALDSPADDAGGPLDGVDLSGVSRDTLVCAIVPEDAICAFCAEYAGNVYPASDYDLVADLWPAHHHCDHQAILLPGSPDDFPDDEL